MNTVILIPAYKPDKELIQTLRPLFERGFRSVVVNDGSPAEFDAVFQEAGKYAEVIGYEKNKGKGGALKHGIAYLAKNYSDCKYFITADADGQHSTEDILRVYESLQNNGSIVLGVRAFQGKIPLRSRVGNDLSRFAYAIAGGKFLPDNQCGLRGFELSLADWLCSIGGSKYDYEINVLMKAAIDRVKITELTVKTIYISDNKSSHFRPLQDTLLIHKRIWSAAWVSLLTFLLSIILAYVFWSIFKNSPYGAEMSLLGSGGISLALGAALSTILSPILYLHILRRVGGYLLRGSVFFAAAFLLAEVLYRLTSLSPANSFLITQFTTVIGGYFIRKTGHSISSKKA